MPGSCKEVFLGIVEIQTLRDLAEFLWHCNHQSDKECGICHLILHRRSGRQSTVLNSQVGNAVSDAIAGTVPAPNRSVMHPQCRELRSCSTSQDLKRIFIRLGNHNGSEARDLIMKEFKN